MKLVDTQQQIMSTEGLLSTLQTNRSARQARIQELRSERQKFIVPARTGSEQASAALDSLTSELESLSKEDGVDGEAIAHLDVQLGALRSTLSSAQREIQRSNVLALIEQAKAGNCERRIGSLVSELRDEIERMFARDAEIIAAIRGFDNEVAQQMAARIQRSDSTVCDFVAVILRDRIPVEINHSYYMELRKGDMPKTASEVFARVGKAVEESKSINAIDVDSFDK